MSEQQDADMAATVTNLASRREQAAAVPGGPPLIEMFTGDDRIIFRDQATLDQYVRDAHGHHDEGDNIVQRIVNAWDCCGTCAGGVLARYVAEYRTSPAQHDGEADR